MHLKLFAVNLLLVLGCQAAGPGERRYQPITMNDPRLTPAEQEQRGRAEIAMPQQSPAVGPQTGAEAPWYRGAYTK